MVNLNKLKQMVLKRGTVLKKSHLEKKPTKIMMGIALVALCVSIAGSKGYASPTEISEDTVILQNNTDGLYITADCTITFRNGSGITIGAADSECPGIEIASGVTLTINNISSNRVTIRGGVKEESGNTYSYAGIYVPENSTLNMQGTGITYAYGGAYENNKGTGAGIGGNGVGIENNSANVNVFKCGIINILGGNVYAYGGVGSEIAQATGAGIGSGGIYNGVESGVATLLAGVSKAINITGGNVHAYGGNAQSLHGSGAGIGSGGIFNDYPSVTNISGGTISSINIETQGTVRATGGGCKDELWASGAGIGSGGIVCFNADATAIVTGAELDSITINNVTKLKALGGSSENPTDVGSEIGAGIGAGIGGGGVVVYKAQEVHGSSVNNVTINGGDIQAIGGEAKLDLHGSGAGIGGGGVYVKSVNISTVEGGNLDAIEINAGTIEAIGASNLDYEGYSGMYGSGAGIGGGGISIYEYNATNVTCGTLGNIIIEDEANVTADYGTAQYIYGYATDIGKGGAYNVWTSINQRNQITKDKIISKDKFGGLYITADCTITFDSEQELKIGQYDIGAPGIDIAPGITVTINNISKNDVYIESGYEEDYYYAGIYVPEDSTLILTGKGTTHVSGNETGAGIGGNGVFISNDSIDASKANAGTINILGGNVYASGGAAYNTTGAGIGGGGINNNYLTEVTAGVPKAINILGGNVYASGGAGCNATGAGIGSGGIMNEADASIINGGIIPIINITTKGTVIATGGNGENTMYGSGAGIGTGGVANVNSLNTTKVIGGTVGNVTIENVSRLQAIGGSAIVNDAPSPLSVKEVVTTEKMGNMLGKNVKYSKYSSDAQVKGTGAGIGGGGVVSAEGKEIFGSGVNKIIIESGTIEAIGGNSELETDGTGAGIGGGGVSVQSNDATYVVGGNIKRIMLNGGTIEAMGGYTTDEITGAGAGIGGGGVVSENETANVKAGTVGQIEKTSKAKVTAISGSSDTGAGIGTGETANGAIVTGGTEQMMRICKVVKNKYYKLIVDNEQATGLIKNDDDTVTVKILNRWNILDRY